MTKRERRSDILVLKNQDRPPGVLRVAEIFLSDLKDRRGIKHAVRNHEDKIRRKFIRVISESQPSPVEEIIDLLFDCLSNIKEVYAELGMCDSDVIQDWKKTWVEVYNKIMDITPEDKLAVVYPGSFDPVTKGHIDLIRRAAKLFPSVVIMVGSNSKKDHLFTQKERIAMIAELLDSPKYSLPDNIEVYGFDGLFVDMLNITFNNPIILRGVRAISDLEAEYAMAMNAKAMSGIETITMMASEHYQFISSSGAKRIASETLNIQRLAHVLHIEIAEHLIERLHTG